MKYAIALIFTFLFIFTPTRVLAATYYVSPNGSDSNNGTSTSTPFKTFNKAWPVLYPGDTLIVMDGTYYQSMAPNVREGQPGNPIIIKAQNDGKAIIDGQNQRTPFSLGESENNWWVASDWFVVEGFVFKNSDGFVMQISGSNNVFKRISAYNANTDTNSAVIGITWQGSQNNLMEDCVAGGSGRKMFYVFKGENNTFRRCLSAWQEWRGASDYDPGAYPWGDGIESYNASYNTFENVISYGKVADRALNIMGQAEADAIGNKVLGSIAMRTSMNYDGSEMNWDCSLKPESSCRDQGSRSSFPRSSFRLGDWNGGTHKDNVFQDIFAWGGAGPGFQSESPTPGNGNKLIRATIVENAQSNTIYWGYDTNAIGFESFAVKQNNKIGGTQYNGSGADLNCRYVDGVKTNCQPLWPWPMEQRIKEEFNTHLTKWHNETPQLKNFSLTCAVTPVLYQYDSINTNPSEWGCDTGGVTVTPIPTATPEPTPTPIPSVITDETFIIEAEDYDASSGVVQIINNNKLGGLGAGSTTTYGFTMASSNAGNYYIDLAFSSNDSDINRNRSATIYVNRGTQNEYSENVSIPVTGGWDTFENIRLTNPVSLNEGYQSLDVVFNTGWFDFDKITFTKTETTPTTTLTPTPTPSVSIDPKYDVNEDGTVNLKDVIYIIKALFT